WIHWRERAPTGPSGDNTNFYYNPFRKSWFYSIRTSNPRGRVRSYRECADFVKGAAWTRDDVIFYASADDDDLQDPDLGYQTELYNLDAVGYESLMLGLCDPSGRDGTSSRCENRTSGTSSGRAQNRAQADRPIGRVCDPGDSRFRSGRIAS